MLERNQIENKVRQIFEMFNSGDFSDASEVMTDEFTYRNTSGEQIQGLDDLEALWSTYDDAFGNLEYEVEDLFWNPNENKGVVLYRQTGTHTGNFQGIDASNNDIDVLICSIGTFDDDGRLVDVYDVVDTLDLMRQIDALPEDAEQLDTTRTGV